MALTSWNDVDKSLLRIGRINRDVAEAEILMNDAIEHVKHEADEKTAAILKERKELEDKIAKYVKANLRDLGDARSKQLTYGTAGVKDLPGKLRYLHGYDEESVAKLLLKRGYAQCVQTKRHVIKNAVKALNLAAEKLEQLGMSAKEKKNQFFYTVDEKKIAEAD